MSLQVHKSDLKAARSELKYPVSKGDLVWCNIPSKTTTRGNTYEVRNVFAYRNHYSHGWQWDYFITIKNDYGYTIKVNAIGYRHRHPSIPEKELLDMKLRDFEKRLTILENEQNKNNSTV